MKMQELLDNLDKSPKNSNSIELEDFETELNISPYTLKLKENAKLEAYWMQVRNCTDTWVGLSAVYLNDVLICVTWQSARRSGTTFYWASNDSRSTLLNALEPRNPEDNSLRIDFTEDLGDGYVLEFVDYLVDDVGYYQGKRCTLNGLPRSTNRNKELVGVTDDQGVYSEVPITEILIPYHTVARTLQTTEAKS